MEHTTTRRWFLGACGALAAGAGALESAEAVEDEPLPIVDTHVHLWNLKQFHLAWIQRGSPLDRSFTLEDYRQATAGCGLAKAVYMEVDVAPEQQLGEVEAITAQCERGDAPLVGAVVSGRPGSSGFEAYLDRLRGNRWVKGLRQVLHGGTPRGYCLEPAFVRGMRQLGERKLTFDLCLRPDELVDAAALAKEAPDTQFVLDHCGNASVRWNAERRRRWEHDLARVADCPNVSGKISGIIASTGGQPWTAADLAPYVDTMLDRFGPDRVVFGGDWPVCTLGAPIADWIRALREIASRRPRDVQQKLFHDNAVRIYGLG